ncbi:hypothetical protein RND81_11G099000 [Saponaria officinalis]|uniref:Uncharacterized protein n=1 Tax=Saponaria officinalis TaxID=3572 RepID=A0AAW1HK53_SAPOF
MYERKLFSRFGSLEKSYFWDLVIIGASRERFSTFSNMIYGDYQPRDCVPHNELYTSQHKSFDPGIDMIKSMFSDYITLEDKSDFEEVRNNIMIATFQWTTFTEEYTRNHLKTICDILMVRLVGSFVFDRGKLRYTHTQIKTLNPKTPKVASDFTTKQYNLYGKKTLQMFGSQASMTIWVFDPGGSSGISWINEVVIIYNLSGFESEFFNHRQDYVTLIIWVFDPSGLGSELAMTKGSRALLLCWFRL